MRVGLRGWAVYFQKLILKKNVLIRVREIQRKRDRCVKGCALGKEEGVRAKTKRVKMSSEKMAPFETVNFRRESILSIHRQVSKKSERARVSNQSARHDSKFVRERERERAREIAIHNPTL